MTKVSTDDLDYLARAIEPVSTPGLTGHKGVHMPINQDGPSAKRTERPSDQRPMIVVFLPPEYIREEIRLDPAKEFLVLPSCCVAWIYSEKTGQYQRLDDE